MAALPIAVQGYHFGMDSASYSTLPTGVSSLLTNRKPNTDVLVVRRVSSCYAGPAAADPCLPPALGCRKGAPPAGAAAIAETAPGSVHFSWGPMGRYSPFGHQAEGMAPFGK